MMTAPVVATEDRAVTSIDTIVLPLKSRTTAMPSSAPQTPGRPATRAPAPTPRTASGPSRSNMSRRAVRKTARTGSGTWVTAAARSGTDMSGLLRFGHRAAAVSQRPDREEHRGDETDREQDHRGRRGNDDEGRRTEGAHRGPDVHDGDRTPVRVTEREQPVVQVHPIGVERRVPSAKAPEHGERHVDQRYEHDGGRQHDRQERRQRLPSRNDLGIDLPRDDDRGAGKNQTDQHRAR